jgi:hypothetical protein
MFEEIELLNGDCHLPWEGSEDKLLITNMRNKLEREAQYP